MNTAVTRWTLIVVFLATGPLVRAQEKPDGPPVFEVGFGQRDITPQGRLPMWGYGARHDMLAEGTLDPLYAKALVIRVGDDKVAIVGTDLGRGPTDSMMQQIRQQLSQQAGIEHVMIAGSHSHHGPVIELTDRKGYGQGKFDEGVAYAKQLPDLLIEAILEADRNGQPAQIGVAAKDLNFNRNRHTKRQPKASDPMLAVIRFDDADGKPLAVLVNFAAHPVMTDNKNLKYSADYPGFMKNKVESALATKCVFMQGAAGDLSPNPGEDRHGPQAFGEALADEVIALAQSLETTIPQRPSVQGKVSRFQFGSRVDFKNPFIKLAFSRAFFPEMVNNVMEEFSEGLAPELNTVVLNEEIALVGGSGEFFSNHSKRLKERSYV